MKIIYRYLIKEVFSFFLVVLFAFTAVLLTIRMLRFASLIVNKGVEPSQILKVFISIVPSFLEIALPLSVLLGIMLALSRLSGDSEVVVSRASGISLYQFITPLLIFGGVIAGFSIFVSHVIKPYSHHVLSNTLFEIARSRTTSGLEPGIFNILGPLTLYSEKIDDKKGELEKVMIEDVKGEELPKVIFAQHGKIQSNSKARTMSLKLFDGEIHEKEGEKYTRTKFTTNLITLSADELLNSGEDSNSIDAKELKTHELREAIKYGKSVLPLLSKEDLEDKSILPQPIPPIFQDEKWNEKRIRKRIAKFEQEMVSRTSLPFSAIILAVIALPLGIQPSRAQKTWGVGISVMLGMGVFILYFALYSIGNVMSQNGAVNTYLSLWIPNFVCLIGAIYLVRKVCSEEWSSIADGLTRVHLYLRKRKSNV